MSKPKFVYLISLVTCSAFCFLSKRHEWWDDKILDYLCSWNRCHLSCDRYFKYHLPQSLNTDLKNFKPWVYSWLFTTKMSHLLGIEGDLGIKWKHGMQVQLGGVRTFATSGAGSKHRCKTTRETEYFDFFFFLKERPMWILMNVEIMAQLTFLKNNHS